MGTVLYKTGRFTCEEHVKRSEDIQNLFKNGRRVSTDGAKMFFIKNNKQYNRIAFAVPRGYGNAVQRNRCKRYSREAYRYNKAHLNTANDLLLLVYPGKNSFSTRCDQFRNLCKKAGLISI